MTTTTNVCDRCGDTCLDINVGFSPAMQGMHCQCGGRWQRPYTTTLDNDDTYMIGDASPPPSAHLHSTRSVWDLLAELPVEDQRQVLNSLAGKIAMFCERST